MTETPTPRNIAETLLEHIPNLVGIDTLISPIDSAPMSNPLVFSQPEGRHTINLTAEWQAALQTLKPFVRKGQANLSDLQSLIDWANRFKGEASALFATISDQPSLTAIIDYHGAGAPTHDPENGDPAAAYGRHRAIYKFPISDEWKLWLSISGKPLAKEEFGEFIEANAKDLLDPTPALLNPRTPPTEEWETGMLRIAQQLQGRFGHYAALVQLSRAFQVHETSNLTVSMNRDSGEASVQFLNEHRDPDGAPLSIPNLFMIAIPVFAYGALYRIPVRFRYRKAGQDVKFIISLHNPHIAFRDAVDEAVTIAHQQTGLPVFRGTAETSGN